MANPVVHWEIGAKDAKKLGEFYSQVFGWKINTDNPMNYGMVSPGGPGGIDGGIFQTRPGDPNYLTFYIQVDDLQASLDKAEALGGKTVVPPMPIPNVGAIALFQDPEGHTVGLFKR